MRTEDRDSHFTFVQRQEIRAIVAEMLSEWTPSASESREASEATADLAGLAITEPIGEVMTRLDGLTKDGFTIETTGLPKRYIVHIVPPDGKPRYCKGNTPHDALRGLDTRCRLEGLYAGEIAKAPIPPEPIEAVKARLGGVFITRISGLAPQVYFLATLKRFVNGDPMGEGPGEDAAIRDLDRKLREAP